jgi:hypothetical protein
MKTQALTIIAMLALSACQTADIPAGEPDAGRQASHGATVSAEIPRVGPRAGDSLARASAPFHLDSAFIQGDSLAIDLTIGGGCADHKLTLYQSDYVYLSQPPGLDLWIRHEGEDHCLALMGRRMTFPLERFRPAYPGGFVYLNRHPDDGGGTLRVQLPPPACLP